MSVTALRDRFPERERYPYDIASIRSLSSLPFAPVTFLIGENGCGKSTLLEAIAVAADLNAEGGTQNFRFSTRESHSDLHRALRLARSSRRPRTRFFLRAESFFNVATEIERLDQEPSLGPPVINSFGGTSLHEQSHGESFLALLKHRFGSEGLYILDEPEAALSVARQLAALRRIHELVRAGSQFIMATHSPVLLAYPDAVIYRMSDEGLCRIAYEDAEPVTLTRGFLSNPAAYIRRIFEADDP